MPDFDEVFPFSISEDNASLEKEILEFDEEAYYQNLGGFYSDVGLVFDGNGSGKTVDILMDYLGN